VVSCILLNGPEYIQILLSGLETWLQDNNFSSIEHARAKVDALRRDAENAAGRENYIRIIHNWGREGV
jgi:hypothetical protein